MAIFFKKKDKEKTDDILIEKKGLLDRLRQGLSKTRTSFTGRLDRLFLGKKEITEDLLDELEENFPGTLEKADFLVKAKHFGRAPGMHRWVGYSMPVETPVRGLYNVGDGCALPGTIGTEGSAASAKAVVEKICNED